MALMTVVRIVSIVVTFWHDQKSVPFALDEFDGSHWFFYSMLPLASAVLAMAIPSICPSVTLHSDIVSKRLHAAGCSLHCQIAKCV